ncbi:protein ref(2)P isoform X2 [Thrips palmi]|uniref:Protein ref(2)P isoform X2 n=1 Tax=Thrips palmi TaxID=161013 RepID=A0A6P8YRP4_THRPL|nr:protein ref(2)P isoform X2 [Thrips palmi]
MASSTPSTAGLNSSGSVSFKAYLSQKGSDKPVEVRRFGVEQNEVTSFDLLKKKLRLVFPNLNGQDFSVSWKDFENDEIIISSNDELLTFLTETSEQVRRLYLTVKNPISVCIQPTFEWKPIDVLLGNAMNSSAADDDSDDDDEEEDGVQFSSGCKRPWQSSLRSSNLKFHPNVYCDGCNKHVPGHRYKCLECEDYDLCHECESQNIHKEHVMLRIPLSMSHYPKLNNFAKGMRYMSDALRKIENRIKKQERRMHKMYDIPFADFSDLADMIPHSKRCKRDDKEKDKKRDDRKDKKDKREKRDRKEKECSSSASGCSAEASASSRANTGCPFPSGILGSFLNPQTLGNLLSPQNLSTLQQLFQHMSPVPETLLQEVAQNLADVRLNDPAPTAPEAAQAGPSTPPTNPFSVHAKKAAAPEASSSGTQSQSPVAERPAMPLPQEAQAAASGSGSSSPKSGRSSRSSSAEADAEGWTVVDAHLKEAGGERDREQTSVYPKLPAKEPTPEQPAAAAAQVSPVAGRPAEPLPAEAMPATPILHRDQGVQECLRALAEMGFDPHQRMIVELAVEYKGNVNRVLNALMN